MSERLHHFSRSTQQSTSGQGISRAGNHLVSLRADDHGRSQWKERHNGMQETSLQVCISTRR